MESNQHLGEYFGTSKQLRETVSNTRRMKMNRFPLVDKSDKFFNIDNQCVKNQNNSLVLTDWKDETNQQRIVIIGTRQLFKQLCNSTMIQIDGTFQSCPKPFSQLVTIFGNNVANDNYTCYGFVYILLTGKSVQVYQQMFKMISDLAMRYGFIMKLKHLLTDFESAIATAAQSQFPHILTYNCYFHYSQSQLKRVRTLGLWNEYNKPESKMWIQLLLVLPMLPPVLIPPAFQAICDQVMPAAIHPMFHWFRENYIDGSFKIANWSVNYLMLNGLAKSQSFAESSHKKLNLILRVKQPNFYKVCEQLKKQIIETEAQVQHHELFGVTLKKRNKNYIASENKIIEIVQSCTEVNILDKFVHRILKLILH